MYDIQSRWKLEGTVLRYYGLRNQPDMFKNTIKLTKKQKAIVEKLPCDLTEEEIVILKNILGVQIVKCERKTVIPSRLDHTPERLDEAVRRIGGDNVRIIFDLYNYLDISNYTSAYDILERGLNIFGDRILLFHVKDFTVENGRLCQCGVGKGILDYEKILGKIFDCSPNATLVLEGTVGEDIDYAISHLKKIINKMTYYSKES